MNSLALPMLAALLGSPASALADPDPAPQLELKNGEVFRRVGTTEVRMAVSCTPLAAVAFEQRGFVACGADGVRVFELSRDPPVELPPLAVDGEATSVFVANAQVWVTVARREARPVSQLRAATTGSTAPHEDSHPATIVGDRSAALRIGKVTERRATTALIDLGRDHDIAKGDHVELFVNEPVVLAAGEPTNRERRVAVVIVTAVSNTSAEVLIGQDERVAAGMLARKTTAEPTQSRLSPPRLGDLLTVEFMVRPFLALGTLGVGTVNEATIAYRFGIPLTVEALFDPIGIGGTSEVRTFVTNATVVPTYDTDQFQVGLGVGVSRVTRMVAEYPQVDTKPTAAVAISQVARLGARDGLSVRVHNTFLLYDQRFKYGSTSGTVLSPIGTSSNLWFLVRGGGGASGYGFGEVGLRFRARGNGDRGSLYLTPSLGFAVLSGEITGVSCGDGSTNCISHRTYGGPMVGFGMEARY